MRITKSAKRVAFVRKTIPLPEKHNASPFPYATAGTIAVTNLLVTMGDLQVGHTRSCNSLPSCSGGIVMYAPHLTQSWIAHAVALSARFIRFYLLLDI